MYKCFNYLNLIFTDEEVKTAVKLYFGNYDLYSIAKALNRNTKEVQILIYDLIENKKIEVRW